MIQNCKMIDCCEKLDQCYIQLSLQLIRIETNRLFSAERRDQWTQVKL